MKILEDTFVIIHIRISHQKILGFSARHFVTSALIFLIAFSAFQIYKSTITQVHLISFIEAAFYTILMIYGSFFWMTSWPKANRMLNKASDYEESLRRHSRKRHH